ncbi:CvpA family protein [Anaerolineales bacterium HSG25]|nr:CvpA family protein [Anaerolineales bacterium HSG25]
MILFGLNELDLLLIIALIMVGMYGATRGAAPQIISAISIWLGMIVALWLYLPLSRRIIKGVFQGWSSNVSDTLAFFILFVVFFWAFKMIINYLVFPPDSAEQKMKAEAKRRKKREREGIQEPAMQRFVIGPLNLIIGFIMGILLAILWWAIALGMMQFIMQNPDLLPVGALKSFAFKLQTSYLVNTVLNPTLYYLALSVSLFIPARATLLTDLLNVILYTR